MGCGDYCLGQFIMGCILSPVILQGLGMFTSDWILDKTCESIKPELDCCTIKFTNYTHNGQVTVENSTSCYSPFGLSDLDATAYNLHSGAFAILILPFAFACLDIWLNKDGDDNDDDNNIGCCTMCGGICFILYPFAGLLSFIGCMIIAAKFSGSSFGVSFKLCLSSSLLVLFITGLLIFFIYYIKKKKVKHSDSNAAQVQTTPSGGAAAPYGAGPPAEVKITVAETRTFEHHSEEGSFSVFIRSINVFHMVTHFNAK